MLSLSVLHFPKNQTFSEEGLAPNWQDSLPGVKIETCQRTLHIWHGNAFLHSGSVPSPVPSIIRPLLLTGMNAYHFLLRFGCGLESALVGEPDVFGQLKQAWNLFEKQATVSPPFRTCFQKLFEDIKEIRSRFLQNLGSQSYGCLTRQLLKSQLERNPALQGGTLLLLGAGQLAQSATPMLWKLVSEKHKKGMISAFALYNRSENRMKDWLKSWPKSISVDGFNTIADLANFEKRSNGQSVDSTCKSEGFPFSGVVSFLPDDPELETDWAKYLQAIPHSVPLILLGALNPHSSYWRSRPLTFNLADILASQSEQTEERREKIALANKACDERAKLRALGPRSAIGVPHSWEDLAHFAV